MNLYFRFFYTIIMGLIRARRGDTIDFPSGSSILWFRCMPTDCDLNGHMTHSRYGSFSDLGRIDWAIRIGMGKIIRDNNWSAMAAAFHIEYRNEIKPFEKFCMHTTLIGWEGSNALAEHVYYVVRNGERHLAARALARVGFYKRSEKRFIMGEEIAELMRFNGTSPTFGPVEQQFMATRLTKRKKKPKETV